MNEHQWDICNFHYLFHSIYQSSTCFELTSGDWIAATKDPLSREKKRESVDSNNQFPRSLPPSYTIRGCAYMIHNYIFPLPTVFSIGNFTAKHHCNLSPHSCSSRTVLWMLLSLSTLFTVHKSVDNDNDFQILSTMANQPIFSLSSPPPTFLWLDHPLVWFPILHVWCWHMSDSETTWI